MTTPAGMSHLSAERSRALRTLFAGVGLGSTGYIAASTVSAIVATELAGTSTLAGVPAATVVLGSAFGSAWLSTVMARRGRRPGLVTGYAVGTVGALIALSAVLAHSFLLFLAGTALLGIANSANQLSRYAAADMVPGERRASTLSTVVWAGTIGGVLGPNLGTLAGGFLAGFGLPELAGVYIVTLVLVAAAAAATWALLRPDPSELAWRPEEAGAPVGAAPVEPVAPAASPAPSYPVASVQSLLRRPSVRLAVLALVAGQVVMTLIMTMTAVHMTEHGHDIAAVGLVISGHVFGMFALSPLSGRLTDRLGPMPVIVAGLCLSAGAAVMGAAAPPDGGPQLFLALFLLGYGWNLGFVAGSSLLSSGLASAERTRIQGVADALIWCSAAAASLGSGVVQSVAGFAALCLLGVALAVGPAVVLVARRRQVAGTPEVSPAG
ncbi:MAG: MFS transporter [Candidatus Limnocylindrales bacterium]